MVRKRVAAVLTLAIVALFAIGVVAIWFQFTLTQRRDLPESPVAVTISLSLS